ncbi:hypothetical protein UF75_4332 [Desulfosporosinus sp. I2]|nr:hypothetical protein UF75_4332 [Desulfosporosinus sp. I2]
MRMCQVVKCSGCGIPSGKVDQPVVSLGGSGVTHFFKTV